MVLSARETMQKLLKLSFLSCRQISEVNATSFDNHAMVGITMRYFTIINRLKLQSFAKDIIAADDTHFRLLDSAEPACDVVESQAELVDIDDQPRPGIGYNVGSLLR